MSVANRIAIKNRIYPIMNSVYPMSGSTFIISPRFRFYLLVEGKFVFIDVIENYIFACDHEDGVRLSVRILTNVCPVFQFSYTLLVKTIKPNAGISFEVCIERSKPCRMS